MTSRISLGRTFSRSFKSGSARLPRIPGVSILTGADFGGVIWIAFRTTSCTTSAENISGFGCCGTTAGIQILDWSDSWSSSSYAGPAERSRFKRRTWPNLASCYSLSWSVVPSRDVTDSAEKRAQTNRFRAVEIDCFLRGTLPNKPAVMIRPN